jgi:C4-dicarboxylate transporter DctM subunit
VLAFERIPHLLAQLITDYAYNWVVFILFVHIVFLVLGMLMDALPPIIILMPILVPVAEQFGMDPIHFGILVAANVGIGMISPPVGICLFVACGIGRTPIEEVVPRLIPFLLILVATLMIITFFPSITLFLPRLLGFAGG